MSTALSSSSSYATPTQLLVYHDVRGMGDLINDDGTRATSATVLASATVQEHLNAASGMVEASCLKAGRYTPTDLGTTLTGVSKELLVKIVCELAWWSLYTRRNPMANMTPSATWAYQQLDALEKGKEIFGFTEHSLAGQPKDDFLSDGHLVGSQVRGELADPIGQPRLERRAALLGGLGDALDQVGEQAATPFEIGLQVPAFGRPHDIERRERFIGHARHRVRRRSDQLGVAVPCPIADRQRLRKAQQIAGRQGARHEPPGPGELNRRADGIGKCLVEVGFDAAVLLNLQGHADLHSSARDVTLNERANSRFQISEARRQPELEVEEAVVQRSNRQADRGRFVFAGHRGKSGHALHRKELVE